MKGIEKLIYAGGLLGVITGIGAVIVGSEMDENWYIKAPGYALAALGGFASGFGIEMYSKIKLRRLETKLRKTKSEIIQNQNFKYN